MNCPFTDLDATSVSCTIQHTCHWGPRGASSYDNNELTVSYHGGRPHVFIFNQPADPDFLLPIEKVAPFKTNFPRKLFV